MKADPGERGGSGTGMFAVSGRPGSSRITSHVNLSVSERFCRDRASVEVPWHELVGNRHGNTLETSSALLVLLLL